MSTRSEEELDRSLRATLDEAARLAPLANPEWPGPAAARAASPPARRRWGLALAATTVLAIAATFVVVNTRNDQRVTAGPPASTGSATPERVVVEQPGGPRGSWAPGSGPRTPLGQLTDVKADPVALATLAVQVGSGSRWVWAVAGAEDRRLRSALDSSVAAPAALSADGGSLAVAFPGLVKVIDLSSGQVRELTSALAGGAAREIVWSPDRAAVAVLRTEGDSRQVPPGASNVEVVSLDGTVRRFAITVTPQGLDWSPDGTRLLTTRETSDRPDGRGQIIDVGAGTATAVPPGRGALVGWYDDRTLLRSAAGPPDEKSIPSPPGGGTTTSIERPGTPQGTVQFLDLDGTSNRQLETNDGTLTQRLHPLDPARRYGLLSPGQGGGRLPYALVVDLQDGTTVGRLIDRRAVPQVIGLGVGTVIVADELNGRFEVKAVDWSNGSATPLAVLPFRDESFSFAPGTQAVLPR